MNNSAQQSEVLVTDLSSLQINDVIRISDGTKKPPMHHSRKLADWENQNQVCLFNGLVEGGERLSVKDKPVPSAVYYVDLANLQVFKQSEEQAESYTPMETPTRRQLPKFPY
ncbi:hypothetical protein [Vibrio vulnificus]|uniref:Uncharacterized protein n=1 Tax=Vibrio vulnificus TaxID=672 RepID=A0A2S3R1Y3_VIBVL|nr:hypothetical protein [Vibrio vulnificus]POB47102.1 hypothetical protein CRN52_13570 [Vibrio vulnificus]